MPDNLPSRASLELVDPLVYAELLNSVAGELADDEVASLETQFVIDEMLRIAAGKGKDGEDTRQMVGLAAPQMGVSKRIVTIDMTATGALQQQNIVATINPTIVGQSEEVVDGREGCWSCANYCANVPRSVRVVLEGLSRTGEQVRYELGGFVARIAQHEVDHLDGIRCIDRVPAGEDWRLHRVMPDEFEDYRTQWKTWDKHFSRDEWKKFRKGEMLTRLT